jgi:hypothetical protein
MLYATDKVEAFLPLTGVSFDVLASDCASNGRRARFPIISTTRFRISAEHGAIRYCKARGTLPERGS